MEIKVEWFFYVDLIWIPKELEKIIDTCTNNFYKWVDGVSFEDGMEGTCFSTINYIDYLNEFYLKDSSEKAYILVENYIPKDKEDERNLKNMKTIYF